MRQRVRTLVSTSSPSAPRVVIVTIAEEVNWTKTEIVEDHLKADLVATQVTGRTEVMKRKQTALVESKSPRMRSMGQGVVAPVEKTRTTTQMLSLRTLTMDRTRVMTRMEVRKSPYPWTTGRPVQRSTLISLASLRGSSRLRACRKRQWLETQKHKPQLSEFYLCYDLLYFLI